MLEQPLDVDGAVATLGTSQFATAIEPMPIVLRFGLKQLAVDLASATAMLDSLGYESALVGSGEAAIDLYRENLERGQPFDAVIIDLTIRGGMGGREAIEHLRKIDPGIKAIVSSGYSTDPIMANYAEYGFSGVVTKPYSLDHLSDALNDLLHAEAMDGR